MINILLNKLCKGKNKGYFANFQNKHLGISIWHLSKTKFKKIQFLYIANKNVYQAYISTFLYLLNLFKVYNNLSNTFTTIYSQKNVYYLKTTILTGVGAGLLFPRLALTGPDPEIWGWVRVHTPSNSSLRFSMRKSDFLNFLPSIWM